MKQGKAESVVAPKVKQNHANYYETLRQEECEQCSASPKDKEEALKKEEKKKTKEQKQKSRKRNNEIRDVNDMAIDEVNQIIKNAEKNKNKEVNAR